jgi:predicted aminopeptidase
MNEVTANPIASQIRFSFRLWLSLLRFLLLPRGMLKRFRSILKVTLLLPLAGSLAACAAPGEGLGYYWQSVRGQLAVMQGARPIDDWLAEASIEPWLRKKLELAKQARKFATNDLGLPDNGSYTKYVDLKRPSVVWNVFATPELSMQLKQWCYPIVGCATYRGFYAKGDAEAYAEYLRGQGWEAYVAGIPAYSTLGWFEDPLLSSFIRYPDAEVARTIFHELGHQVLYIQGDTTFNESFASAIEEIGLEKWLQAQPEREALTKNYAEFTRRKKDFVSLLKKHRLALEAVYKEVGDDAQKRQGKAQVFSNLQSEYLALKETWGGFKGYDGWFSQKLSNAHLATVATYSDLVPGFIALHQKMGQPMPLKPWFDAMRDLSKKPKTERDSILGLPVPVASESPASK